MLMLLNKHILLLLEVLEERASRLHNESSLETMRHDIGLQSFTIFVRVCRIKSFDATYVGQSILRDWLQNAYRLRAHNL